MNYFWCGKKSIKPLNQIFITKQNKHFFKFGLLLFFAIAISGSMRGQTDVTSTYITNPRFSSSNANGWVNTQNDFTVGFGSNTMEYYKGSISNMSSCFSLTQQLTSLPEGVYRLTMNGFNRSDVAYTNIIFYGLTTNKQYQTNLKTLASETAAYNSTPNSISTASAAFNSTAVPGGYWLNTIDNIIVEDGNLRIGLTNIGQLRAPSNNSWTIFSNFKLFRLEGVALQPLLNSTIYEAQAQAALNYSNVAALNDAISTAQSIDASAIVYNDIKALRTAINNYKTSSLFDATELNPVNATFRIKNAGFEDGASHMTRTQVGSSGTEFAISGGGGYFSPIGWTTTIASAALGNGSTWDGAVVSNSNVHPIAGSGLLNPSEGSYFYAIRKRWNTGAISISQTVTDLPTGYYRLAVDLGTATNVSTTGSFTATVNSSNVFTATPNTQPLNAYTSDLFFIESGQNLNLTMSMLGGSDYRIIMDNVSLTYYGFDEPVINASQTSLSFTPSQTSRSITVSGSHLEDDVMIEFSNEAFTADIPTTIPKASVMAPGGVTFNVLCSSNVPISGAQMTLTSTGALGVNVSLSIDESATLTLNKRTIRFDQSSGNNQTFNVNQGDYFNDVILTAPAGITLTKVSDDSPVSSLTKAEVVSGSVGIRATWDETTVINNANIKVESGTKKDTIIVNAHPNNLIANWDGNGITGAGSKPNEVGWLNTVSASIPWSDANTAGGCRFRDFNVTNGHTGFTHESNGQISETRQLMLRFDASGYSSSTYAFPVELVACKQYKFNFDFVVGGSATPPQNLNVGISTTIAASGRLSSQTFASTSLTTVYRNANYTFTVPTSGTYYMTFGGVFAWYGITNLLLVEDAGDENLLVSTSDLFFDANNLEKTFTVTGNLLLNSVTLSAPSGITLDITSITAEAAQCGVTVTATFDNNTTISDGKIEIISGSLTHDITVNTSVDAGCFSPLYADRTNLISDPYLNNLSNFAGWGARSINTNPDFVYCGSRSGMVTGENGGSLDHTLTGLLKTNTTYRVRAKVYAIGGAFQIGVFGWSSGQGDLTHPISTTDSWQDVDFTFTTGSALGGTQGIFFNNFHTGGITGYIDNWEMYEVGTVVPSELVVSSNTSVYDLNVRPGAKLTVNADVTLTVNGNLVLENNVAGSAATLLKSGTINVSGTTTVQQYLNSGRNWYFASPVTGAQSGVIKSTEGNNLWKRDVAEAQWTSISAVDEALTPVRGYIANVAESGTVSFTGALNDGALSLSLVGYPEVTSGMFHLVGNPYASYLNWQSVIAANEDVMPTLWFRTKTAGEGAASQYAFATVLIADNMPVVVRNNAVAEVTNLIPPMQGFWVRMKNGVETTQFAVNNSMRSHGDVAGNRLKAPAAVNRLLRLEVTNGTSIDESVIYFNQNASDAFDMYDSPKMFNNITSNPEIYTRAGNEKLVINGLSQYAYGTQIAIGFKTGVSNSYSIRASEWSNFDTDTRVVLLDQYTQAQFDLTDGDAYHFSSDAVDTEDRFVVIFRSATGTTEDAMHLDRMFVSSENSRIRLQLNSNIDNANVTVYNTAGMNIYSQQIANQSTILNKTFDPGVYLVKVENGGKSVVLRTIVR